jgi:hypothetical protein
VLLTDIRGIFDRRRIDRLPSITLVEDLVAIEDGPWAEWRGTRLSQGQLAKLLAPFGIRPKTVWLVPRTKGSRNGYYRWQFEGSWAAYCPEVHTPTPPNSFNYLGPHSDHTASDDVGDDVDSRKH